VTGDMQMQMQTELRRTRGLSVPAALHGASRRRGRKQAITSIAKADRDRYLVERRVNVARRRHG